MSDELPKSDVAGPTRIDPFAALKERLAAAPADAPPEPELEAWIAHADFERQRDAEGNTRYDSPTDCEGMLRIMDEHASPWIVVCDGCSFEVGVQMARIDPSRIVERNLARAGIPDDFAGKTFEKNRAEQEGALGPCRLWIRNFRPQNLANSIPAPAIWGKSGRGKSHLVALIVEALIRNYQVDALYRSEAELFDELRSGMDEGSYETRWQRALRVPVLVIDDLGAGKMTDWKHDRLQALLDHRYSRALPVIVATNLPPAAWEHKFGDRINSRLRGMTLPFELKGADNRAQGVQESFAAAPEAEAA